jgi:hypothetical protein
LSSFNSAELSGQSDRDWGHDDFMPKHQNFCNIKNIKPLIVFTLPFPSCASNSRVETIGEATFMVSRQTASLSSDSGILEAEAFAEANALFQNLGKSFQVISTYEARPSHILTIFPKAEVQIMRLKRDDNALWRPKLNEKEDKVIDINLKLTLYMYLVDRLMFLLSK